MKLSFSDIVPNFSEIENLVVIDDTIDSFVNLSKSFGEQIYKSGENPIMPSTILFGGNWDAFTEYLVVTLKTRSDFVVFHEKLPKLDDLDMKNYISTILYAFGKHSSSSSHYLYFSNEAMDELLEKIDSLI